ncbi:hypothetical protein CV102_10350 [Natronococcus pandeyae]|uniref:Uncharacterized protein n=2 Tax=Natronococcus pandeyae TaxID=2055836 RepID=A0A8J8Q4Q9_9EURY|nr:hypothetical protein CV102_10350 [Natronococcus pandeyae]
MSMALTHFAVGATLTTVLVTFVFSLIPYPRTVVLIGGGWAMIPDVYRLSPIAQNRLEEFHDSPWADLFWFHHTLDRLDATDSELIAAVSVVILIGVTALSEWYVYRQKVKGDGDEL